MERLVYVAVEQFPEFFNWLADNDLTEPLYELIIWWYPQL